MTKGYVALMDVLGFSDALLNQGSEKFLQDYQAVLSDAVAGSAGAEYVVFSDSIILTQPGTGFGDLLAISRACALLMFALLKRNIPVRGAISYGEYVRSSMQSANVFVAGNPIVDAYRYEQAQKWIGVMLTPTVVRKDGELLAKGGTGQFSMPVSGGIESCREIPIAEGGAAPAAYEGYAVVPCSLSTTNIVATDVRQWTLPCLKRMKASAPSPAEQAKYSRTVNWLTSAYAEDYDYSNE
jgi:hypothetical protein